MQIRRPLAALVAALALFGGGPTTLTACGGPTTPNEGTTDDTGDSDSGDEIDRGNLPNNSDPEQDTEDQDDDTQDPD